MFAAHASSPLIGGYVFDSDSDDSAVLNQLNPPHPTPTTPTSPTQLPAMLLPAPPRTWSKDPATATGDPPRPGATSMGPKPWLLVTSGGSYRFI